MLSLVLLLAAAAQQQPAADPPPIVVTGQRLSDTETKLKECLARHCPVDEDVAASVAHAENQFVAGRYKDARGTLLAAIGRDKKFAKQYPVPVSGLLRANARIAAHLGEGDAYRIGMIDMISALRAGLPDDDPRILMAQLEVADSQVQFARYDLAEAGYSRTAARARALNLPRVEGYALLRRASLLTQLAEEDKAAYGSRARAALAELVASTVPAHAPFLRAARVLQARMASAQGDNGAIDRLIAEYRKDATTRPVLLSGDPIHLPERRAQESGNDTSQIVSQNTLMQQQMQSVDDQWVDVSFWVAPDGHTTDAGVLRQSPHFTGEWIKPVLTAVRSRRYAPLKLEPSDPGILRVERYTFTARWTQATGSRLRVREAQPRIEMLDLSVDAPPSPPPAAGTG